ncbi:hypothetical protein G6514_001027 [Epicoccum nigrum]|nr:hypothetical protein G6514_001027 [Epicoccum nigrum]
MLTNIFAVTAAMAATASAFDCHGNYFSFFNRAGPMSYQQIDPALFPGKQSPHLHSFDGGNAVSSSSDFNSQMGSSCTTARIKPDKSLYWRPTLFWNGNNTGFHRVPEQAAKIYYKFGDDDSWANVTEFPEDFNMMAGDPFKRSDGDNPAGIRWACHQPDGRDDKIFTNGFPSGFTSCKYGFASEVTFPSCWNGEKLNPSKPNDHMAYPTGSGVGTDKCPTTHRVARFPTIFIEFWYDISSFDKTYSASSTPWVLSNGDPTGYGMHADFLNGWEKGILGKATAETGGCNCGCGCGDDQMKQCFGAENVNESSDSNWDQCAADTTVSNAIFDKLPGCNPVQSGPARASVASGAGCSATAVASATSSAVSSIASAAASAVSSAVNISISIPNKGYASDAYPTADEASSSPAEASSTPAAAESYSAPYPFPIGNSTVAPTATGQYSYSIGASHKSHGHNHSKFHASKSTASPATPSDANAETASSCTASAPVTVTYTPTVTVSAKAMAAAVDSTTVTTLTSYVTVTATATGY